MIGSMKNCQYSLLNREGDEIIFSAASEDDLTNHSKMLVKYYLWVVKNDWILLVASRLESGG